MVTSGETLGKNDRLPEKSCWYATIQKSQAAASWAIVNVNNIFMIKLVEYISLLYLFTCLGFCLVFFTV